MAIAIGVLAALLAIVLQRVAVALAGGLAGGMLAMQIAVGLGMRADSTAWIFFVIGAVLAAVLVSVVFDWALIILSALIGASVISNILRVDPSVRLISLIVLFVIGVIVQSKLSAPPPGLKTAAPSSIFIFHFDTPGCFVRLFLPSF